ncbi:MAG TPA: cbb3-type cytochrome c oxidase subunit 3 [Rudaea sp.]|nr:cbb3-type cytochrome c oxidase subunit 3 [Rudaea sp.]
MNPVWGPIAGTFIVLMMLTFIGIWIWAWLPRHKRVFGKLARIPLEDEDDVAMDSDNNGDRP